MKLADKIMCLRKQKGWSQEELAYRLDVSRQSVSKWEGNQSIPDMDKILQLSELFNVTTDYLLKEELTEEHANLDEEDLELIKPRTVSDRETRDYLEVMKKGSKRIAFGVSLCIFGAISVVFFAGTAEIQPIFESQSLQLALGLIGLFVSIAIAVGIFILSANGMNEYSYISQSVISLDKRTKERITDEFMKVKKKSNTTILIGVIILILAVLPLVLGGVLGLEDYYLILLVVLMLFLVMIAVYWIVLSAMNLSGYEALLNKGSKSKKSKETKSLIESIESIYWVIIVAIYLGWSFMSGDWYMTWIVWPIAGVISQIIPEIIKLRNRDK